jgi:pyruvate dehydrogenase E1 component beta subunit
VVDPRTLAPLDINTILKSVKKTGRLVLVDQATRHASAAAIIAAEVAEHGSKLLKAPLKMVTTLDTSIPCSEPLENFVLSNEEKIVAAVKSVLARQAASI